MAKMAYLDVITYKQEKGWWQPQCHRGPVAREASGSLHRKLCQEGTFEK